MNKILLVDDDRELTSLLKELLEMEGFNVIVAHDGEQALDLLDDSIDLLLLDVMMPKKNGIDTLKALRQTHQTPVIMLTARGSELDRVLGLELGADDYIMKPFDSKEMVARVRAVLRRYHPVKTEAPEREKTKCVEYDGITINLTNYSVICDGKNVDMPPKELELLYCLASSPNQVFTREQLLDRIWGYEYVGDTRTVDVHIKRLREKIKDHPRWSLSTVWGIGYKFETK